MIDTRHFRHLRCAKALLDIPEATAMAAAYRRVAAAKREAAQRERRSKERGAARRAGDLNAGADRIALIADELERAVAAADGPRETCA